MAEKYPDFVKSTGYGTVTGLCGANCYHSFSPFVLGFSTPNYTDDELKKLNEQENNTVEYNGKKYTRYEATQHQRSLERTLHAKNQAVELLKQGGADKADIQIAEAQYRKTSHEYAQFSKAMGLPQQRQRIQLKNIGNTLTSDKNSGNINLVNNYHSGIFGELKNKIKNILANKSYLPVSEEYFNELPKKASVSNSYEDMKATNPHYNDSYQYQINCQRCVPAYEMRRRGYNVTAKPAPDDDILGLIFEKIFVDMKWKTCPNGSGIDDIREYMKKCGNGARAEISLQTCDGSHLFMAEQHNGVTYFIDPQNYKANADLYFEKILIAPTRVCRIDDLKFSELIRECCEKVSE